MASRLKLARVGAAVAGTSVALMMLAALPAGAEPVTGKVDPHGYTNGYHVNVGSGFDDVSTSLIGFEVADGSRLQMYCVEIETRIDKEHSMVEKPWDSYPNPKSPFHNNRAKINWILHNGFPVVGVDALGQTLTGSGAQLHDGLDEKEAIAATQAAVWHYSDGKDLDEAKPLPKGPYDGSAEDVVALYKYLTGGTNVGIGEQPTPALAVAPATLEGEAGERIGPFTVTTTGEIEKLTSNLPEGVKITDANGTELTEAAIQDGTQLFVDVPADAEAGEGTFELDARAGVDTGRLFVGENYEQNPTQSVIVAKAETSEIAASAGVKWTAASGVAGTSSEVPTTTVETTTPAPTTTETTTPAPQPKATSGDLAQTGASIFAPIVIGVVLVGAGVGSLLFLRHRRRV